MLKKTAILFLLLTVLALMALSVKVSAYDWNQDAGSGYAYQAPRPYYQLEQPNYGYNSGYNSLVYARASAHAQYDAAVARGDSKGAKHLGNAIRELDRQIAAIPNLT